MNFLRALIIPAVLSVVGCTTIDTNSNFSWGENTHESAKVIVLRGDKWVSNMVEAGFGNQSEYVVALKTMEYAELSIPIGIRKARIGSPQTVSSSVNLSLSPSATTCIMIDANVSPMVLAVTIPILYWVFPSFSAEIITCPSAVELAKYKRVL